MNAPSYGRGNAFSATWSGSGDVEIVGPDVCTLATVGKKATTAATYISKGTVDNGLGVGAGEFLLTSGADALPFIVVFEDTTPLGTAHTLSYNAWSGSNQGGARQGTVDCGNFTPHSNSRLKIIVPEASLYGYPGLANAANGLYQARLRITNHNEETGETADRAFKVRVVKDVAQVRITGLDPLDFGALSPGSGNDAVLSDGFCVHSSSGNYSLLAAGGAALDGTSGSFAMDNSAGTDQLEYTVEYDDNGGFVAAAANLVNGVLVDNGGAGFPGNPSDDLCGGGSNASLRVTIPALEVDAAPADSYNDTLVIIVAPI